MSFFYLTADEAQTWLLSERLCSLETLPTLPDLSNLLTKIQLEMDNWLGWSLAPTEYTENLYSNWQGILTTYRYPVIEVLSVIAIAPTVIGQPLRRISVMATVTGSRTIQVGGSKKYEVTYVAGYDPVPGIARQTMFEILKKVMFEEIELNARTRYLSNVGLQGGVSQGFQLGGEPKNATSSRNIDDLMLPLSKYKRRLIT